MTTTLSLFDDEQKSSGPVECLGQTFPSDAARREHYLAILRERLKAPVFRAIKGFPVGSDEDILALCDPPYYTACPNPFIEDFIKHYGKPYDPAETYSRESLAVDVSVGKTDALYKAHGYHTKVPHLAIVPSIPHYAEPGDIVLDGRDLERIREKTLLKEFEGCRAHTGRRLRVFRLDAMRAGFRNALASKDYATIIAVVQKIPEVTLQEDEKLLLWYDQALTRMESGT